MIKYWVVFFFQLLKQQQDGLKHLVDIIKDDSQDVQLMEQNLDASSFSRRWHQQRSSISVLCCVDYPRSSVQRIKETCFKVPWCWIQEHMTFIHIWMKLHFWSQFLMFSICYPISCFKCLLLETFYAFVNRWYSE